MLCTRGLKPALANLRPLPGHPPHAFGWALDVSWTFAPNPRENDDLGGNSTRCGRNLTCVHTASRWFESNELTHWLFLRIVFVTSLAKNKSFSGVATAAQPVAC